MTSFVRARVVRFSECDPAGIVFYPRYFEMMNDLVEDWFADALDVNFKVLINVRGLGIPMARIETEFFKPCMLGDNITLSLRVLRMGLSSVRAEILGAAAGETHFRAEILLVCVTLADKKSIEIPADMRERMGKFLVPAS